MTATFQRMAHTAWAVAMFLALAALLKWKHRRMWVEHRINRCLRAYAAHWPSGREEDEYPQPGSDQEPCPKEEIQQAQ